MAFDKLAPDERIIANYGLIIKDLYKFWLEGYYECSLDDIKKDQQLRGISKDGYGGIKYYNYMYPDAYDDDDRKDDKPLDDNHLYYTNLSISKTLEKYFMTAFGDYIVPSDILEYVKQCRKDGSLSDNRVTFSLSQYKAAYDIAQLLARETKIPPYSIIGMIGSFAHECGWNFGKGIINRYEQQNKAGTVAFAAGDNCGEGWFGVTNVKTKMRCLEGIGKSVAKYQVGMIANLSLEEWAKLCQFWVNNMIPKDKREALMTNPTNDDERRKNIWSAWLYKAAPGVPLNWNAVKRQIQAYKNTHARMSAAKPVDSFGGMVYMAIMFSLFAKDPTKVPDMPF